MEGGKFLLHSSFQKSFRLPLHPLSYVSPITFNFTHSLQFHPLPSVYGSCFFAVDADGSHKGLTMTHGDSRRDRLPHTGTSWRLIGLSTATSWSKENMESQAVHTI